MGEPTMKAGRQGGVGRLAGGACAFLVGPPQVARASSVEASSPGGTGSACSPSGCPADAPSAALPADDPFYRYPVDLSGQAPGTVLKSRPSRSGSWRVGLDWERHRSCTARRGNWASRRPRWRPSSRARARKAARRRVLPGPLRRARAPMRPSYNLRAGVAPVDRVVTPTVIGEYVAAGFAVVVPDYEQEQFANGAG